MSYVNPSALGLSSVALFRPTSLEPVMAAASGDEPESAADVQTGGAMLGGFDTRKLAIAALIVGALWYASQG